MYNDILIGVTIRAYHYIDQKSKIHLSIPRGVEIKQWQPTDSILVIYSMYLDLQGSQVEFDLAREALLNTFGEEIYNFLKNRKYIKLDCLNRKIY